MRLSLVSALSLLFVISQAQTVAPEPSDLVVLKFSCGRYQNRNSMIRSVHDPDENRNEPIRINQSPRNEPQEVINRRDMQERRAAMIEAEINAALSTQKGSPIYFYHLEIKNAGAKVMRNFAWEYQPGEAPDPSDRQFFCVVRAKPNERKTFDLFTPLAPSRVVDAASAAEEPDKNRSRKVIINMIEYVDGSVWKRTGWNALVFPAEAVQKVEAGKCIGL
jgi:hypothetical protein